MAWLLKRIRSKTYWLQIMTAAAALASMPEFQAVIPPDVLPWVVLGSALLGVAVREMTRGPVSEK